MFYKKLINFSKNDNRFDPTDIYVQGVKKPLTPREKDKAKKEPTKVISKRDVGNDLSVKTTERNPKSSKVDYAKHLLKEGRYNAITHVSRAVERKFSGPSLISKAKDKYTDKSKEYSEKRMQHASGLKGDTKIAFDETRAVAFAAFDTVIKPVGKAVAGKVASKVVDATKSMGGISNMIKPIFEKLGIEVDDVKKEGEIFVRGNDNKDDFNAHFFRCRGTGAVKDLLVFSTTVGGKTFMAVIGIAAGTMMLSNPLTAPFGFLLMAMSAKKSFEGIVIDSPQKLASILISLAQGFKDKHTDIKLVDDEGLPTKGAYKAIEGYVNDDLPNLLSETKKSSSELPGLTNESIKKTWDELPSLEQNFYNNMHEGFEYAREISKENNMSKKIEVDLSANFLPGVTTAKFKNENQNYGDFPGSFAGRITSEKTHNENKKSRS